MDAGSAPKPRWRHYLPLAAPPAGGKLAARLRHLRSRLWLLGVVALACAISVYYVSAGGLHTWPVYMNYLDLQADGFRAGHLYLPLEPAPALVAAADPYDRVNIRYWALDLSYFKGKYYCYWGPLPALLQALVKEILGVQRSIGDQYIGLFSACLATWSAALIVERMGRRLFGSVSRPLLALGILAFACANPMLHNVTTAATYQSSILAAQAWLLPGLLFAFDAVWHAGTSLARRSHLLLAGVCWAFALASRITVLLPVAVLIAVTALFEAWPNRRRWLRALTSALWLGLPVFATGIALLVYNDLRFESPTEFGLNLQLSGYPRLTFAPQFWLANIYSYSLRPFVASCQFPYLYQVWGMKMSAAFPASITVPPGYNTDEPVIGWLIAVPITWFIAFAFLLVPRPISPRFRHHRAYWWCLISFSSVASLTGLIALGVYGATMRYLSDITPGLALLGLLGAFALKTHRFGQLAPRLTTTVFSVLALATIVMGLLIGYQGYNGHFHKFNPTLDEKLVKALSLCGKSEPEIPRYMP